MSIFAELKRGITTASAGATRDLAARIAPELPIDATLALHGDLGVGKTTFVQGLAQGLGVSDAVTSPTFNIFTVHRGHLRNLVHLDAYRLENEPQIEALMLDDFLVSPYCLAVEWPEKISSWLPKNTVHLTLSILGKNKHHLQLTPSQSV